MSNLENSLLFDMALAESALINTMKNPSCMGLNQIAEENSVPEYSNHISVPLNVSGKKTLPTEFPSSAPTLTNSTAAPLSSHFGMISYQCQEKNADRFQKNSNRNDPYRLRRNEMARISRKKKKRIE